MKYKHIWKSGMRPNFLPKKTAMAAQNCHTEMSSSPSMIKTTASKIIIMAINEKDLRSKVKKKKKGKKTYDQHCPSHCHHLSLQFQNFIFNWTNKTFELRFICSGNLWEYRQRYKQVFFLSNNGSKFNLGFYFLLVSFFFFLERGNGETSFFLNDNAGQLYVGKG